MKQIINETDKLIEILDERFYTNDGAIYYPSVTTILQAYPKGHQYYDWLKSVGFNGDIIRDRAAEVGSKIHNAIENYLKGVVLNFQDGYTLEEWILINKFMKFDSHLGKIEAIETQVVSEIMKLGGTLDLVCMINGERWLIDHKTSNALYKSYDIQLSVYKSMWEEAYPDKKIDRVGIFWLKAQTRTEKNDPIQGIGWQLKEVKDFEHLNNLYKATRILWDEQNPNYKPRNKEYPLEFAKYKTKKSF